MRKNREGFYKDEWWIEYLESELDPSQEQEFDLLLKNSEADRSTLESYQRLREVVKSSDPIYVTEDGRYFNELHDKIMAQVDDEAAEPSSLLAAGRKLSRQAKVRTPFTSLLLVLALMAIGYKTVERQSSPTNQSQPYQTQPTQTQATQTQTTVLAAAAPELFDHREKAYGYEIDFYRDLTEHRSFGRQRVLNKPTPVRD